MIMSIKITPLKRKARNYIIDETFFYRNMQLKSDNNTSITHEIVIPY